MTATGETHAKSALRALDVLELLAQCVTPVPTGAVARECDIPRSSTHQLLNALRSRGFVTYYEGEHAWGIGPKLLEVSQGYRAAEPLQRLAGPVLDRLVARAEETAHLAILVGSEVVYLVKRQPRGRSVVLVTEVGVRLPAHLAATGQAILAGLDDAQFRALYAGESNLTNRTGSGPRTPADLAHLLGEVRTRGYALERGGVSRGITCLGAALAPTIGLPPAAVGLTWVDAGRTESQVEDFARLVRSAADRLSRLVHGDEYDTSPTIHRKRR